MSGRDDFFIGWAGRLPRDHRLAVVARLLIGVLTVLTLGLLLGHGLDDPGPGGFEPAGDVTRHGVLTLHPSPILWMAPDTAHPKGHSLLLSGEGKNGPLLDPTLDGKTIAATGAIIRRGDLEMLQIDRVDAAADGAVLAPPIVPLGTWRIEGEICDGKCAAGAMRPGGGLAHRACAILCLNGALPPVFVATGPIEGQDFLLLADQAGGTAWHDLVGLRVRLDGSITRHGDILIFRADLAHAVVVR
jgi:hypothetical protein